jgi:hypothetical protein
MRADRLLSYSECGRRANPDLDGAGPWLGLIPSVILNARSLIRVRCADQVMVEVFGNFFGSLRVGYEEVSDPRSRPPPPACSPVLPTF